MKERNLIVAEFLIALDEMRSVKSHIEEYIMIDNTYEDLTNLFKAYLNKNRNTFDRDKVLQLCQLVAEGMPNSDLEDIVYTKYKLFYDYHYMYNSESNTIAIVEELKSKLTTDKYKKQLAYMELPIAINNFDMIKIKELYNVINE